VRSLTIVLLIRIFYYLTQSYPYGKIQKLNFVPQLLLFSLIDKKSEKQQWVILYVLFCIYAAFSSGLI